MDYTKLADKILKTDYVVQTEKGYLWAPKHIINQLDNIDMVKG